MPKASRKQRNPRGRCARAKALATAITAMIESLESRVLLSGSNAIDTVNFGNFASETAHSFDVGFTSLPLAGSGALGQTYRAPVATAGTPTAGTDNEMQFTLTVSSTLQNYLTVRLWGGDTTPVWIDLNGADSIFGVVDSNNNGGPAPAPNEFYYDTFPIAIASTQGKTSVQLTLYESNAPNTTQFARPIYSAYTSTNPDFIPDSSLPTGTPLAQTGQVTSYAALTAAQVLGTSTAPGILLSNREAIYGSGGSYSQTLGDMITTANAPNAPAEVIGLDLWTNVTAWEAANPNATADQWRDQVGGGSHGAGYSTTPEPLLSLLSSTYVLPPFTDMNGNTVSGIDHYHDPTVLQQLVSVLDGTTYLEASDGGIQNDGPTPNIWQGLTSTPRATGHGYAGSTARGGGWGLSLEGVDDQAIGEAIISILNDPVGASAFETYLSQSFDANLTSAGYNTGQPTSVMRAFAYEQMLYNNMNYLLRVTGGTESQSMFEELGMYSDQVALEKLQALYPNSAYPAQAPDTAFGIVKQVMGLIPFTFTTGGPGGDPGGVANYGLTEAGLGEAGGANSSGYDGRYGSILPWLAPGFAQLVQEDPGLTSTADQTAITQIEGQARATIDAYDQFISPLQDYNGITDGYVLSQEDFITYRDPYNPNSDGFHFTLNAQYAASDPSAGINDALALRSAYLETQYGLGGGLPNYGRNLENYENTLRSLINVNPATLTSLPGEPGQPNHAWADVQNGTVSAYYDGERFYLNTNWRNNNGDLGTPSELARVDDTTATVEKTSLFYLPYNSATEQSDGNLTSTTVLEPWFVRYGNWLCAFNNSTSSTTVQLPAGSGTAIDLLTGTTYALGATISLAAGHSMVLYINATTAAQPIANGTYTLYNGTSHLALGDPNGSTAAGALIDQEAINTASANQQWIFTYNGNGYYTVQNDASKLYLDDPNGQNTSGTVLDQAAASNSANQLWEVSGSGTNYSLINDASGLVVSDPSVTTSAQPVAFATAPAAGQDLETSTANQNQALAIIPVAASTQPIPNGTYTLTLALDGLAMDAQSNLEQNTPGTTTLTQQWVFTYNGSGYYTIKNVGTNTYLSGVSGGLSLQTATGGNEQLWLLSDTGLGYEISCKSGNGIIDDSGGSTSPGNQLINYTSGTGGINETWLPLLYAGVTASPNPVTGTTSTVTATVNTDVVTAASLIYNWSGTGPAGGAVTFSTSGTNAASTTTATYTRAGTYTLNLTITNGTTDISTGSATVIVNQSPTLISISPAVATLNQGQTQHYSATVTDQFGFALPIQPTIGFSLGAGSVGSITADGQYTASTTAGTATVTATSGAGLTASIPITISNAAPTAPTGLSATALNAGQIQLAWAGNTLSQSYTIGRATVSGGPYTTIASGVTSARFTDTALKSSTTYYYVVTAVNGRYPGAASTQASATTLAPVALTGTVIGTSGSYESQGNGGTNAFDGNLSTYFDSPDASGDWVGLDLGSGVTAGIDQIRYCPRLNYASRMVGGVFQGANTANFSDAVTLFTVTKAPAYSAFTTVSMSNTTPFRYLRYLGPSNSNCNVAEIQFDGYSSTSTTPPTVATSASVTPNPAGTSANLSVLGSDVEGASALTYNWTFSGPAAVAVRSNNSNAAQTSSATFTQAGTYTAAATITDAVGLSITSLTNVNVDFGAFATSQDIGSPSIAGSLSYAPSSGTYTVGGSGSDIWNTSDQFRFSYGTLPANGSISAEVTSETNTDANAKAGVMVRASAAANAAYAIVWVTPSDAVKFELRSSTGASATDIASTSNLSSAPYVKLVRSGTGTSFTAYYSTDGVNWTQLGSTQTVNVGTGAALAGLAVTSHNTGLLNTATIANVLLNADAPPTVATPAAAFASTVTGQTVSLSVLGADDNGESGLTYTWSAALTPPDAVLPTFSVNGTNAAKNTVVSFAQAGTYTFVVTITDASGLTTGGSVTVTVTPTFTTLFLDPASATVSESSTTPFTATALDQFGKTLASQPTISYSITSGGGTLTSPSNGAASYTAASTAGPAMIQAASGSVISATTVNVDPNWLSTASIAIWNPSTGMLTVTGPSTIIADPGSDEPIIEASGSSAAITIDPSSGTDIHIGGLNLTNGASATLTSLGSARSVSNYHLLVIGVAGATGAPAYAIDATSTLDLTDNDMAILYGSGSSPLTTVNGELLEARDGGLWDMPGLTSTAARNEGGTTALGFGEASTLDLTTFDGLTLGGNAVLVKYTLVGDANLDGNVGLADYNTVLSHYNGTGQPWTSGSFDYLGSVGLADYNTVLANYNQTLADVLPSNTPALAAVDPASGTSAVSAAASSTSSKTSTATGGAATVLPKRPKHVRKTESR
jgi:hypothetical protein